MPFGVNALSFAVAAALGSLLGGVLASARGLTTPFWIAAAAMAVISAVAWRPIRDASAAGVAR